MVREIFDTVHGQRYANLSQHEKAALVKDLAAMELESRRLEVYLARIAAQSDLSTQSAVHLNTVLRKLQFSASAMEDGPEKDVLKGAARDLGELPAIGRDNLKERMKALSNANGSVKESDARI